MNALKQRVRTWLKRRDKTQEWLADELGISQAHLSMILSGARTPSLSVASLLETKTGIPARDFDQVAS